ncbi:MAG TPA: translation initiation factor IF-2 [Pyrinomonadaceae bacterium]|jgi:translation initiation factor IF-2|nr:translation initiation factor IF-2 [Pyrinomonadaceae bacterium]
MTVSKVRLYDLAKELKLDTKRLIEEVRREGVDVSVPSNSISKELADKIRNKYFPKKEAVAPRAVRVVKKAVRPEEAPAAAAAALPEEEATLAPSASETGTAAGAETSRPVAAPPPFSSEQGQAVKPAMPVRMVKKPLSPAIRAEQPATATLATEAAPQEASTAESSLPAPLLEADVSLQAEPEAEDLNGAGAPSAATEGMMEAPQMAAPSMEAQHSSAAAPPPPARQVRVLRPTKAAIDAGIRHGERAPVPVAPPPPQPPQPSPRERRERQERAERGERPSRGAANARSEQRGAFEPSGTPGETATPQTVYTPPPSDRRRGRSTRSSARGNHKMQEGKGGRFGDRDYIPPPKTLSLEDRIAGRLDIATVGTELKPVRLVEGTTVKEFAEKLGIKPKDVVTLLLQRGVFATINQPLNDDVAVDLGHRFGYEVAFVPFEEMVAEEEFEELVDTGADDVELPRDPVVTVMGHVDHGKTSLLDGIRSTEVAAGEAGGITQHIGAYRVAVQNPDNPSEMRHVVFLDTPGHEAFTLMRARGAKATDVVVLVVAADDGVMPQTIEAIEHSRAAGVPIVVAINKIDRPDANPDRVRQELANQGLQPVEWGGDTEMVPVSAKRRENLDTLLETILLTADILNLRASPTRLASGVVLEAKLDRGRGAVATVLVQQGTLRVHDPFIVGQIFGKVRAMFDDRGAPVTEAGPATPVEVLGLQGVPQAGESFQVVADITRAQQISHHRQMLTRQNTLLQTTKRGIEALGQTEVKELLVVIKADVQGSVEVLKSTLQKLSTDQVKVKVIRSGVGAITESDVLLASATQAGASQTAVVIIGFNVRPEVRAAELAKQESVDIRLHSIIYKVEEEIRAAMIGMLEAIERERILGKAEVREVFRVPRVGAVAGCMVIDGTIRRNARARLIRDGIVTWEGGIASLRRFKDDASEVREGFECGIGLENFNDIKVSDQIEAYIIEKVAATEL